jgi:SAM-dependent methyltransferase
MDVTNRFVLDFARRFAGAHAGARILDFGCGAGELVREGRAAGLEIYGTDVFYGGSRARSAAEASGLLGSVIRETSGHHIPFPDNYFDMVVSNQVMEHIQDLDPVIAEIHRVLRPGSVALNIFPSRDVWREGHIGIPFSHWFPRDTRARLLYTWTLRRLGLGTWKQEASTCLQWARDKLAWIDAYTHYRRRPEIFRVFGRYFRSEMRESDYIRYRLRDRPWRSPLARLLDLPLVPAVASAVFRKLAFLVIVSRKEEE